MTGGIINVLKPPGMTSHDAVSFIRKVYGIKRVGHAGTLDPAAAGVLPIAVGRATRLIEYFTDHDKSYRVELTLGYETDSGDDTGNIINTSQAAMPPGETIAAVLASFTGAIEQVPPMYSAIKVQGKKLYEFAREGKVIERKARVVRIYKISLLSVVGSTVLFDVDCSKGTYIRSLCIDIGRKLGIPAVMSFLVRTKAGPFLLSDAHTLEEIQEQPELLLEPADGYLSLPKMILDSDSARAFKNGRNIISDGSECNLVRIYDPLFTFIGIGKRVEKTLKPVKIIAAE
jgi:tRNA pseudouridine55 synthase